MRDKAHVEPLDKRFDRYNNALGRRNLWNTQLEQAYRWMMPNRINLLDDNFQATGTNLAIRGEQRMNWIFDPTGIESLQSFANNMQTSLMPPYSEWADLELDENFVDPKQNQRFHDQFGPITEQTIRDVRDQLESATKILFDNFQKARLDQVVNEAMLDVGISTGVMIVNEGTLEQPLQFQAIPANKVVIEGGPYESLANFFNPLRMPISEIMVRWPEAKLNSNLENQLKNSPHTPIDLIEATLYYPENEIGQQYYYFVMTNGGEHELVGQWREIDPWIGFRGGKSPGEIYGRGPALTALPTVRVLNKLQEFMLRSAQMQAYPILMMTNTGDVNPNTIEMSPGALVPFGPDIMQGKDPIRPLQLSGNVQATQEQIQDMQQGIREMMFANPIGPNTPVSQSATQSTILNNNWIMKNAGFFSRLSVELFPQLIDKSLHILTRRNVLPLLDINGVKIPMRLNRGIIRLQYTNPAGKAEEEREAQAILQGMQESINLFGPGEGLLPYNIAEFQDEVLSKLGTPESMLNPQFKGVAEALMQSIMGQLQQAAQPQQQQGVAPSPQPSATGTPSPVSASAQVAQPLSGGGAPGGQ